MQPDLPTIRLRKRPDLNPVMVHNCAYCGLPFYYRPSMGIRVTSEGVDKIKLPCGYCEKQTYVPAPPLLRIMKTYDPVTGTYKNVDGDTLH